VAPELHALGLLTTLDLQTFAAYCWAFGHWRETEEALAALAPDDDGARVLTRISRRASEDMVRFAGGFGMTPAARSKVAAGDRTTKSKFDGLIG
jgi:phage terminase small subunit